MSCLSEWFIYVFVYIFFFNQFSHPLPSSHQKVFHMHKVPFRKCFGVGFSSSLLEGSIVVWSIHQCGLMIFFLFLTQWFNMRFLEPSKCFLRNLLSVSSTLGLNRGYFIQSTDSAGKRNKYWEHFDVGDGKTQTKSGTLESRSKKGF